LLTERDNQARCNDCDCGFEKAGAIVEATDANGLLASTLLAALHAQHCVREKQLVVRLSILRERDCKTSTAEQFYEVLVCFDIGPGPATVLAKASDIREVLGHNNDRGVEVALPSRIGSHSVRVVNTTLDSRSIFKAPLAKGAGLSFFDE
jgi:hypothetical protein